MPFVEELLSEDVQIKRARKIEPTGKVHKVFEKASVWVATWNSAAHKVRLPIDSCNPRLS